ncbi:MAG: hypothetical protein ACI9US_000915, partial [Gammaproteobacteria bacterium]
RDHSFNDRMILKKVLAKTFTSPVVHDERVLCCELLSLLASESAA